MEPCFSVSSQPSGYSWASAVVIRRRGQGWGMRRVKVSVMLFSAHELWVTSLFLEGRRGPVDTFPCVFLWYIQAPACVYMNISDCIVLFIEVSSRMITHDRLPHLWISLILLSFPMVLLLGSGVSGSQREEKRMWEEKNLCTTPLRGAFKEAAKSISRGFRVRSWEPAF